MKILPYKTTFPPGYDFYDNNGSYMNRIGNWVTVKEEHHGHDDCSEYGILQPIYCKGFPGVVWKDVMS